MNNRQLSVDLLNDSFPPVIDGVANTVYNYATILSQGGDRVTVATPSYPGAEDKYDFRVIRYPSLDTTSKVGYRTGMPFMSETTAKAAETLPDIIHCHCPIVSNMLARTLREVTDAPVVFTYHTKFDIDIARAIRSEFLQEQAIKLLVGNISACDEVWVVSRGAGENLRSLGYTGTYMIMENGVDFSRGRTAAQEIDSVCGEYDLPSGVPVFIFVGRMMWYKGIGIILDALESLMLSGFDFRMVFVGDGGDMEEIRARANALHLTEKCIFVGSVHDRSELKAWYCRADLFLFPSTFDTNGIVVREAAACSLPCVVVRGSCAAEGLKDGETGIFIDEDARSMYSVLRAVCAGSIPIREIGENACEKIYISWEDSVAKARERYLAVIDDHASGRHIRRKTTFDDFFSVVGDVERALEKARKFRTEKILPVLHHSGGAHDSSDRYL